MNLLEKCEIIALGDDWLRNGFPTDEDKKIYDEELKFAPIICKAILDAMEEMERASDDSLKSKLYSTYSDDWWNGLAAAYKNSANILRKHLGTGK